MKVYLQFVVHPFLIQFICFFFLSCVIFGFFFFLLEVLTSRRSCQTHKDECFMRYPNMYTEKWLAKMRRRRVFSKCSVGYLMKLSFECLI